MAGSNNLLRSLGLLVVLLLLSGLANADAADLPSTGLTGIVKSPDGKPMAGVTVSARERDKTVTVSVYTNKDGEYFFPRLTDGQYHVWAQAVGFEMGSSDEKVSPSERTQKDFVLRAIEDFHNQLSSGAWANSLPTDTPENRRMARIFYYNCSACHLKGWVLSKRFDAAGWKIVIDDMLNTQMSPTSFNHQFLSAYEDELIAYLTWLRGPMPSPIKFKVPERVTGEGAEIVVTEYDIPRAGQPDFVSHHNGSDWSEGIQTRYFAKPVGNVVVSKNGKIYFTYGATPERTIGELDPETGHVTNYKLEDKVGFAVLTHRAAVDQQGNVWATNLTEETVLERLLNGPEFRKEEFQRIPKTSSISKSTEGSQFVADSKGNMWAAYLNGVFRLDPKTGEYKEFEAGNADNGNIYDIVIDSGDDVWFTEYWNDRIGFVDGRTAVLNEIALPRLNTQLSAKDASISYHGLPEIDRKGPRKLAVDRNGDSVWVAEYWTAALAKIDIHTKKITEFKVPDPESHPEGVVVDKNHMVWMSFESGDQVLKFNPFTEQFTSYPLPTLGSRSVLIDVDNSTDPPTIWMPYSATNKIARIQFRPSSENHKK